MKTFLYSIFLLVSISSYGQYNFKENYFELNKGSGYKNYTELSGNYFIGSSSLSNEILNVAINSGFISDDLKTKNLDKINSVNSLGFSTGASLKYKKAEKGFNLTSSVGTHLISNNTFTKDFYKLLLFGNEPYAGQNMNVRNTSIYLLAYNKLSLGAEKMIKEKFFLGASLNVYQSLNYRNAKLLKGDIYTQKDGESINFDLDYEQFSSNTNNKSLGAGLDFYFMSKYKKANVLFHVEDFGFIAQKDLTFFHADSSYMFQGIEIENIFDFSNNNYGSGNNNEVHEILNVAKQNKSKNIWMPTKVTLGVQEVISDKWFLEIYANYRAIPAYLPQLIIKPSRFFGKNFSLAPIFSIGGFNKADVGLNISYHHKRFLLNLDVQELENLLLNQQSSGRGMFLRTGLLF